MHDLLKAYESNFAIKCKRFEIKFRSAKDHQQSIVIHSKHCHASRGSYVFLHNIKTIEPLPCELKYDSHIVMNRLGEFYICILQLLDAQAESQGPADRGEGVISLDPGICTFMTGNI